MTEFEWLRQMRGLNQPLAPANDLWHAIDAALPEREPTHRPAVTVRLAPRRWLLAAGLAASVILAGGIGWGLLRVANDAAPGETSLAAAQPWKPADPRLAGVAIELDAARMELQLALRQAPNSTALQRLLERTQSQQNQLRQRLHQAS